MSEAGFSLLTAGNVYYRDAPDVASLTTYIGESNNDPTNRYVIWLTSANYDITSGPAELLWIYGDVIIVRDLSEPPAIIRKAFGGNLRLFHVQPQGHLLLINVAIENFGNVGAGGAIYNQGELLLYRTAFRENRAVDGGAITSLGSLRIWNSTFTDNDAIGGGGALANDSAGEITVQCTTFQENGADYGGAISGYQGNTITIHNSNFINNDGRRPDLYGMSSAIYNSPAPKPPIDATQNWWNATDGPRTPNRNAGGNSISLNVNFEPYITTEAVNIQDPAVCPEPPDVVIPPETLPTPTPTPTLTPTPTQTPIPTFTNIDFYNAHRPLRSVMFWAIFHETSEDRFYFGNDVSANVERDTESRTLASFLIGPPYCNNGNNTAQDEQLGQSQGWHQNVSSISHCNDIRYLEAQTIINRFLNNERRFAYDASRPESLMQLVFNTMFSGFGGSLGSGNNVLWNSEDVAACTDPDNMTLLPSNAPRLPTREENGWIDSNGDPHDYDSGPDGEYYSYSTIANKILTTNGDEARAWRWMAVRWLDGYLACKHYLPLDRFPDSSQYLTQREQATYSRIMDQIDLAIEHLYQQQTDPTDGAFDIKLANLPVDRNGDGTIDNAERRRAITLSLCVGGCTDVGPHGAYIIPINNVTVGDVTYHYHHNSPPLISTCATEAQIAAYDDTLHDHIDQVRNCYYPAYDTLIQPVLWFDLNGYRWETLVLQQTSDMSHTPRYTVDICVVNPDITNCN